MHASNRLRHDSVNVVFHALSYSRTDGFIHICSMRSQTDVISYGKYAYFVENKRGKIHKYVKAYYRPIYVKR